MEALPKDSMTERNEVSPQLPDLEAPYITAVKSVVHEKIPEQAKDFDAFFDLMNTELMGNGEGKGLFVWESKKYPGVRFLAGQVHISKDWVQKLSPGKKESPFQTERRIKSQVRFIQPALGSGNDGSGLSALDMAFSPALDIVNMVSQAIENGEEPPTGDIFVLGSPTAIGGATTETFNEAVRKAKDTLDQKGHTIGFDPYGEIYAEFMRDQLPKTEQELESVRVVLEGVSKGTITADRTWHHLPRKIEVRTQVLLDNIAGVHGDNKLTKIGRGANMLLFLAEAGVRMRNPIAKALTKTQPQFYKDIAEKLGIEPDSEEQKKLKKALANAELMTLWHGTPIDKSKRTYVRIPTPDPANINFKAMGRVRRLNSRRFATSLPQAERQPSLEDWAIQEGEMILFPNSNKVHMWNWERNIESGSWSRKMKKIVGNKTPQS